MCGVIALVWPRETMDAPWRDHGSSIGDRWRDSAYRARNSEVGTWHETGRLDITYE